MTAAIYARKSTAQQDVPDDAKSTKRQVEGARSFITSKGWTVVQEYSDNGVSGALFANRVEFQRMMRDAEAGLFEHLVFYDLDRFGRTARHTMTALNTLADLGIIIWDYSTGQQVDLDSFEGEMMTFMKARFAQQYRDQVRKHTRDAMRKKAEQGYVTGGKVFGYDNHRVGKGHVERRINDGEAAIVREIYERFAAGEGPRSIAGALNRRKVTSPRAQQGRPNGWSFSTVRSVLERPLYRGEIVYGRSAKAYGRELGKRSGREKGMIAKPESNWLRISAEHLRIVNPDVAARVDARRLNRSTRYHASLAKGGRVPERAHGKYLLSGGMLVCPTCGGHFEARIAPWKGVENVYICSTRRRKPGCCTNTLALPIAETDDAVLGIVEGEVLGTRFIEELIALVDRGETDNTAHLMADRERLSRELVNLGDAVAIGGDDVPVPTLLGEIRKREAEKTRIEAILRKPRPERPNIDKLRAALEQRAADWRAELRAEPKVARLLLRRLVGPLTLWEEPCRWEADPKLDLLDGLVHHVASPAGTDQKLRPKFRLFLPAA